MAWQDESAPCGDDGPGTTVDPLLEVLMDAAPVGLILFDEQLRVDFMNKVATQLTGLPRDWHVGRPAKAVFADVAPEFLQAVEQVSSTGELSDPVEIEVPGAPTGTARLWWCRFFSWQPSAERERKVGGVVIDATERHLVELGRAEILSDERAARTELERVRDRLAFVLHASSRLATSLDVSTTWATLGDLMVPRFGRYCVVDLWDGERLERIFVHGSADSDPQLVHRLYELSGRQGTEHPAVQAARSAQSVVVATTDTALAGRMYPHPPGPELVMATSEGHGLTCVPLSTRGRVVGVLTLVGPAHSGVREPSGGQDLTVVEQVASRAAQSIETARLFDTERRLARNLAESERQQREAALTLQRSLLPDSTYQPDELEVAARYFPGSQEAEVGGDWYDVIPVAPGHTALVIGDVMGRGLSAATLMGQVRTAVRAYARQNLPPRQILDLVDGVVAELGDEEIVTCVYAVFDAINATLTYASAGHPPPLIIDPHGAARRLEHEAGLPLGVATCGAPEHVVDIPAGTLAVFYTDGLVEYRDRDVEAGIDVLTSTVQGAPIAPEQLCDSVVDTLRPSDGYDDDVALLIARAHGAQTAEHTDTLALSVPPGPTATPFVRSEVDRRLRQWGVDDDRRADIVLSCSELVTNALRHGAPPIELQLRRRSASIDVEVSDTAALPPERMRPAATDEGGRGLLLVSRLATRWGWHRTTAGKTVWCEHAL